MILQLTAKEQRLLELVRKHSGLDAIALKGKGWNPRVHGSLRDAEKRGFLKYTNGGWYINEPLTTSPLPSTQLDKN